MPRRTNEYILLVGDQERRLQSAVAGAMPAANVTSVATPFDAIAELNTGLFGGIVVDIGPIVARPEAAIRVLREAAGDSRLILYADPAAEPLSRHLLEYGADDYVIAPTGPNELADLLRPAPVNAGPRDAGKADHPNQLDTRSSDSHNGSTSVAANDGHDGSPQSHPPADEDNTSHNSAEQSERRDEPPAAAPLTASHSPQALNPVDGDGSDRSDVVAQPLLQQSAVDRTTSDVQFAGVSRATGNTSVDLDPGLVALQNLPLTDLLLSAMIEQPQNAVPSIVTSINERLSQHMTLSLIGPDDAPPAADPGRAIFVQPMRSDSDAVHRQLVLNAADDVDKRGVQQQMLHLAALLGKTQQIDDRQTRLQKMAITDDLTGVYNARYFKHFLTRLLEKARTRRFPVTLFLFDIDNFKQYNDQYGHGVGDEILCQTASLMKRCSRDHDLVARISGDEFAVVFWEKDGPRQPFDGLNAPPPGRLPQTPLQIADRFRKQLGDSELNEFNALGTAGKGTLTISGGMSVYPYDARDADELIEAADKALMFGAKKGGKNSIYLVGADEDAVVGEESAD